MTALDIDHEGGWVELENSVVIVKSYAALLKNTSRSTAICVTVYEWIDF